MNNPRRATVFHFLAVVTIAYAALQGVRLSWVTDDAYISFRYAQNLLAGKGLVCPWHETGLRARVMVYRLGHSVVSRHLGAAVPFHLHPHWPQRFHRPSGGSHGRRAPS